METFITDEQIAQIVSEEFRLKILGTTASYLDIHQPILENGDPVIARIDRDNQEQIIAYIPVKNEHFFFAVYIDALTGSLVSMRTEAKNTVYFIARSEMLGAAQLSAIITLKPTEIWDKGTPQPFGKRLFQESILVIEPNPEPDEFEDKLENLLDYLLSDPDGIRELSINYEGNIHAISDYHKGNQLLGGIQLSPQIIAKMSNLGLGLSFDITAWGESFK